MRFLKWAGLAVAAVGAALGLVTFGFLGFALHGIFFAFEAALAGSIAGIAAWWIRERRRAYEAEIAAQDDTRVLDLAAIAAHKPPSPRRPSARLRRWRHACGRAARRIREGAL